MLMESLPSVAALTLVRQPNLHLVVPPLVAGTFLWLLVVGRRMDAGVRYALYCAAAAAAAWAGAGIMLILHDHMTSPSVTNTPGGGWDVVYMPGTIRVLLGIALGALVPVLLAVCDRVPWRRWTWSLLAAFPVAYLVLVQVVPPGVKAWFFLPALAWLSLLPSALRSAQWPRPPQAHGQPG